jgi:hypothetical protein
MPTHSRLRGSTLRVVYECRIGIGRSAADGGGGGCCHGQLKVEAALLDMDEGVVTFLGPHPRLQPQAAGINPFESNDV